MIELDDTPGRLDIATVHGWIAGSYWSPGIARELFERALAGSHSLGAYYGGQQIGFARAITDHATFAWIADVFVAETHRGQGLARRMVSWFLDDPRFHGIRRVALMTMDAHGVYAGLGFAPSLRPDFYMERMSGEAMALLAGL